ncbi:MAG TPA: arginine--tRNA ligase [Candidatus Omnitrophota bacterium]|nr:arginine--tRNA ligase [Candidatus Omnitrophota bacterium]
MLSILRRQLEEAVQASVQELLQDVCSEIPPAELEKTKERSHGDFSCSLALRLARVLKKNPMQIAEDIRVSIDRQLARSMIGACVEKIEIKNPGFINFYLASGAFFSVVKEILETKEDFGRGSDSQKKKVVIEFVSANPTGPLTVAHARQAAVGDALGNILAFLGFQVTKEYYINDEGNQIRILGRSVKLRAQEILGATIEFPEDHYQGGYIKEMAKSFLADNKITDMDALSVLADRSFESFSVEYLMGLIRQDLKDFGVQFDIWTSQAKVATNETIDAALKVISDRGYIYPQDGAMWFKTTALGDDKDRVVKKSDGHYTYLAPDIAYHKNKFDRKFDWVIDILGPDHHGYISRLKAAVQALGYDPKQLDVIIVQLATLYRKGEPVSMSTRKGEFVSLREVIDEVGSDAARVFFLMRHTDAHLDFDLELAKEQSPENPVFYIQYAHARINSIFVKAKEAKIVSAVENFSLLTQEEEMDLIKKMASFEDALSMCLHQIDPYALLAYLTDLAASFHRFYDAHKVISEDAGLSSQRLALVAAAKIVFANGLTLLGVTVPERM